MTALIFRIELPLELAPRMNTVATKAMQWQKVAIKQKIDAAIFVAFALWPEWRAGHVEHVVIRKSRSKKHKGMPIRCIERVGGRRRAVTVTRHSTTEPDELSVDVCGGKYPIDRLVAAGVLVDDNRAWCEREARWEKAPPKKGKLVVEVYEIADVENIEAQKCAGWREIF